MKKIVQKHNLILFSSVKVNGASDNIKTNLHAVNSAH